MNTKVKPESDRTTLWLFIVLLFFISSLLIMWKIGLFNIDAKDSTAKIIASVLALIGVLFTSVVSLLGLLLKHTYDSRDLRLKEESAQRLKMETAIQALSLMNSTSGVESSKSQQIGALFALVSLNQMDLALSILAQRWPNHDIDCDSAVWIIDKALQTDSFYFQKESTIILRKNAKQLITEDELFFPQSVEFVWPIEFHVYARENLFKTLIDILLSKTLITFNESLLNAIYVIIYRIMVTETEYRIRAGATYVMEILLMNYYKKNENINGFWVLSECLEFEKIEAVIKKIKEVLELGEDFNDCGDSETVKLLVRLNEWSLETNES